MFGWTADEATSFHLLDTFVAAGFNLIDTADMYSRWVPGHQGGESETIIGRWLHRGAKRDQVVIATKVGMEMGPGQKGLSKPYILASVEKSLARLQTDYIDLYQSHQDDPATPLEETLSAYAQLIQQGKVRAIGASNYTADRLALALKTSRDHKLPRYECLQPLYNLSDRAVYEDALESVCQQAGIGVIPYYSLAAGFLTGKYRTEKDLAGRAAPTRSSSISTSAGLRILKALDQVAGHFAAKPAQVALAWLVARPSITAPIVSATSLDQLADLLQAPDTKARHLGARHSQPGQQVAAPARRRANLGKVSRRDATGQGFLPLPSSLPSHHRFFGFAGANANHARQIGNKDLAIANLAGTRNRHDRFDDGRDIRRGNDDFKLHLGQEFDGVFHAAIGVGMSFLPAKAAHLRHRHALHSFGGQGVFDFFELEMANNCFDFLHRVPLLLASTGSGIAHLPLPAWYCIGLVSPDVALQ